MRWDAKTSQAQREANARYDADNTKQISLKLNLSTDADILEWLGKKSNKQGYIKELIRWDLAESKKKL